MDRKRNILIREIMGLIDEAEDLQARIDRTFSEAYASMRLAEISMGGSTPRGADAVPIDDSFSLRFRSVMGVELPRVESEPQLPPGPPPTASPSRARTSTTPTSSSRRSRSSSASRPDRKQHLSPGLRNQKSAETRKRFAKTSSSQVSIPRSPASPTRSRKGARGVRSGSRWSRAASRRRT